MNGSDGVMITHESLSHGVYHSLLSVEATLAGDFVYMCEAQLQIEGDNPVFDYDNTTVHVQGGCYGNTCLEHASYIRFLKY